MIEQKSIILRPAVMQDAVFIYELMQQVHDAMEDPSMFICDDLAFVQEHIEKRGFTVVACDSERIVGSFIIRFPGYDEDNLGREIGLTGDELRRVVHMESAVVHPEYRGLHLQARMLLYAQERITAEKRPFSDAALDTDTVGISEQGWQTDSVKEVIAADGEKNWYCMATAAPDNAASCRTLERAGYRIAAVKEKYGGLKRNIYVKLLVRAKVIS